MTVLSVVLVDEIRSRQLSKAVVESNFQPSWRKQISNDSGPSNANSAFLVEDPCVGAHCARAARLGSIHGPFWGVSDCRRAGFFGIAVNDGCRLWILRDRLPGMRQTVAWPDRTEAMPAMFSYGKVFEGEYYELEPDFVNKTPLLAVLLGDRREMPPLCCACGAPAERTERFTYYPGRVCLRP